MRNRLLLLLTTSVGLLAQGRGEATSYGRILFPGGTPTVNNGTSPYGRILFPGTPNAQSQVGTSSRRQSTSVVNRRGSGRPVAAVLPYVGFPIGNYLQVDGPVAEPAEPTVVVNQYFPANTPGNTPAPAAPMATPRPVERVTETNPDERAIYLIAMQDHTIFAARSYWVEQATLHYVTLQGDHNSASLDLVDRALSQRLNRGQSVAFGVQ
jgi:hypothetical protein